MRFWQRCAPLFTVPVLLALSGCAMERLNRFNAFAQAGTMYITASQTVIQNAGTAVVNTDSALLVKERPNLDQARRTQVVIESNKLLRQRLQVLSLIGVHGKLLQAYFEALASLSDTKAKNSVGTAAQDVYNSLANMSPGLKNCKIGSTSISSFIPSVTAPVVATFKVHALNEELKARSEAISKELALQEAAFNAIEAELRTDTQEQQNFNETDSVDQFETAKSLPADWASQRLILLSTPAAVAAADAAAKAAAKLRATFTALVENRADNTDFNSLMTDISNMLTTAESIQGTAK